jgi:quercetin dioxygenase-like cupin family protein
MKPITVAESPVIPNPNGLDAHRLFASPLVEVVHIHLPAGQALVRHASPVDTLFYVIDGTATVESGSERVTAPAGTLTPNPARTMHRVVNETAAQLRFLVIKTPKPSEPPVFER